MPSRPFIGGHPMAGGPLGGFKQSSAHLYQDAEVALCPSQKTSTHHHELVSTLWRSVGAIPVEVDAVSHDEIVAQTSHLPYLCAIAQTLLAGSLPNKPLLRGPGFRDATKRALFSPKVMADVARHNPSLSANARRLAEQLETLAVALENTPDEFEKMANEAAHWQREQQIKQG